MPETRKYTVVDLFAGVGGLSYGFSRNEHYEIILANEMQKDIAKRGKAPQISGDKIYDNLLNPIYIACRS